MSAGSDFVGLTQDTTCSKDRISGLLIRNINDSQIIYHISLNYMLGSQLWPSAAVTKYILLEYVKRVKSYLCLNLCLNLDSCLRLQKSGTVKVT